MWVCWGNVTKWRVLAGVSSQYLVRVRCKECFLLGWKRSTLGRVECFSVVSCGHEGRVHTRTLSLMRACPPVCTIYIPSQMVVGHFCWNTCSLCQGYEHPICCNLCISGSLPSSLSMFMWCAECKTSGLFPFGCSMLESAVHARYCLTFAWVHSLRLATLRKQHNPLSYSSIRVPVPCSQSWLCCVARCTCIGVRVVDSCASATC